MDRPASLSDPTRRQVRSFVVIVATFVVLLAISLVASWAAIYVVNATRAYATGEGRYSKAQKIAVIKLHRFAYSGQQADFDAFAAATAPPRGDRQARLALESRPPDVAAAAAGFLAGQNHPSDVSALIALFRVFSWWQPFAAALADWQEGDRLVAALIDEGTRMKTLSDDGLLDAAARARELEAIDAIDDRLTDLENTFSTHMGEAARAATRLVVIGLGVTMVLLWVIGMAFATRLLRRQLALDRQLAASEQRFRDYAEVASDWYWEMDADHRVTAVSEQFFALTEAAPESVLARSFWEFVTAYSDRADNQVQRAALGARAPFRGLRLCYPRADGTDVFLSLSAKPHFDVDAGFLGYRGIGSDITASIKEAALIQARQEAEVANQAKTRFLAVMSHEIRTPMNGVLGTATLLARTRLDGRQTGLVANLLRSGQALLGVINDILDFSKIEAGHFDLVEMPFDPCETIAEVVDLLNESAAAKGLELVYFVDPAVPPQVIGDRNRLRRILINLVGNAIKFTDRGEVVIELGLAAGAAEHAALGFTVADSGIGIAPERHAQIFESFQQVDDSMTRMRGGTGLGLAITKRLVELMGGEIGVESALGRGACFRFTVRCRHAPAAPPAPRALARSLRALIVDTNAASAQAIARTLAAWRVEATVTASIAAAETAERSAAVMGGGFDAVLVDVKGLGAAAVDFLRRGRMLARGGPPAHVLLVGPGVSDIDTLADVEAFATLDKPAHPRELFDCLAAIAAGARRYESAPLRLGDDDGTAGARFEARVLLAEDNPVNQEVASGILTVMGCRVVTAPDGAAAVALLESQPFDLVLMDCEMPVMDGFSATRRIREIEARGGGTAHVPIVALTAHALAEVRDRCFAAGMDDFLVKPFDEKTLVQTLRHWLAPRAATAAARSASALPDGAG